MGAEVADGAAPGVHAKEITDIGNFIKQFELHTPYDLMR